MNAGKLGVERVTVNYTVRGNGAEPRPRLGAQGFRFFKLKGFGKLIGKINVELRSCAYMKIQNKSGITI